VPGSLFFTFFFSNILAAHLLAYSQDYRDDMGASKSRVQKSFSACSHDTLTFFTFFFSNILAAHVLNYSQEYRDDMVASKSRVKKSFSVCSHDQSHFHSLKAQPTVSDDAKHIQ
jgi:hypothetical protein